jgi:arabinosaccharide transport system substrate-binding protein
MSKLSRRAFLKTVGLASGGVLAACAPTVVQPATDTDSQGAPAGNQPVKLELWTFVNTHARWFSSMAEDYVKEKNENFELNVVELPGADMFDKLKLALLSGGAGAPDLADIEQGAFGQFLRGKSEPDLVDLKPYLTAGGYMEELVASREALYTYNGKVYGVEHALTPVVLYYRSDIYEDAGINVDNLATWQDWIEASKDVAQGDISAIAFPTHDVLLRQNGSDYFDANGQVTLDGQASIDTMQWILDLRDVHKVGAQGPSGDAYWSAFKEGKFLSAVGADWYGGFFKDLAPELQGKMKAMPLPAFNPGGVRTSCHGGTGLTIVKFSPNVEEAWKFEEYSMLSIEGNVRRFELTTLFPPYIPAMDDPRLHKADEYFSGMDMGALFAEVGPSVPPQYQSPYRSELNSKVSGVWQDIYDLNLTPEAAFKEVSEEIRKVMAEEGAA